MSRPGGGFNTAAEPILTHDQSDMDETLSGMNEKLRDLLQKMAEDSSNSKLKLHTRIEATELEQLSKERSLPPQNAQVGGCGLL